MVELYNEDCRDTMERIPDGTIDLMLTDMPYGTTACKWDVLPDLTKMWVEWERILKPDATWVFTCSQPVTSKLIISNEKYFKYCWVWDKMKAGNIFLAEYQPMKIHEDVVVFQRGDIIFNSVKTPRRGLKKSKNYGTGATMGGDYKREDKTYIFDSKFPESILQFSNAYQNRKIHPTQKPINLFRYLIQTYTNEGDLVYDGYCGSGTTAVACILEKRNFIGAELNEEYYKGAIKRINDELSKIKLF
jgi:site-specific DNA-methyltransferase (adenine-specific)